MKLVIKLWCLPNQNEAQLRKIHKGIVAAVERVKQLSLKGKESLIVLFPKDAMQYGLGSEIHIEVTCLPEPPELEVTGTTGIRHKLATSLGTTVKKLFPKAVVQCDVAPPDQRRGFWSSESRARMGRRHKPTSHDLYGPPT